MLAVIADDLTGAAELGGIGLNSGLKVEISSKVNPSTEADLLVIATDTRSKTEIEAVAEMEKVSRLIAQLNPQLIFKKVDSVLRGYVLAETSAQLEALNLGRALLVPANPALGRTIENGSYLIDGKPIAETAFSGDPEFPAKSSDVIKLLRAGNQSVTVKKTDEELPSEGIIVGEAATEADLTRWAEFSGSGSLLAGASGFFRAILKQTELSKPHTHTLTNESLTGALLYVCGSAFAKSTHLVKKIFNSGGSVSYMPEEINFGDNSADMDKWSNEICNLIRENGKAIIAIDSESKIYLTASELRSTMALVVKTVFEKLTIDELIIEGGSTASSVLKQLQIDTLEPVNEYATGVIRSKVIDRGLHITLKPGSYSWPKHVWAF